MIASLNLNLVSFYFIKTLEYITVILLVYKYLLCDDFQDVI
jgi:hypothetical protein